MADAAFDRGAKVLTVTLPLRSWTAAAYAAAAAARAAARAPPAPGMDCGAGLRVGANVLRARGERRHVMGAPLVRVRGTPVSRTHTVAVPA